MAENNSKNASSKGNSPQNLSRYLADLSGPEISQRLNPGSILILPLGAIEQHGPHLPMSVDYLIADEAGKAIAQSFGEELDIWLLPTLAVTKSNEHAWSAGTLWLRPETLLAVLDDIAASAARTKAERLVFLNAHGGNSSLLNVACREIRLKHGLKTFLMHPFVPIDQGSSDADAKSGGAQNKINPQFEIHGGFAETSLMLHLKPEFVNMELAEANVPEKMAENKYVKFGGAVTFGWLSNDFGPQGSIGDPTGATPEQGKMLFEKLVQSLGQQLGEIASFDFGR